MLWCSLGLIFVLSNNLGLGMDPILDLIFSPRFGLSLVLVFLFVLVLILGLVLVLALSQFCIIYGLDLVVVLFWSWP